MFCSMYDLFCIYYFYVFLIYSFTAAYVSDQSESAEVLSMKLSIH